MNSQPLINPKEGILGKDQGSPSTGDTLSLIRRQQLSPVSTSFQFQRQDQFGGQIYKRSNLTLASIGTLMGYNAIASGDKSVALGGFSYARDTGCISVGVYANSNYAGSISIGYQAKTEAFSAIAIGGYARANYQQGVALGKYAYANGPTGISIGSNALSQTDTAETPAGIAIGSDSQAIAESSIAIGVLSTSAGAWGVAIGFTATVNDADSVAIGDEALADTLNSVVVGGLAYSFAASSVAVGYFATIENGAGLFNTIIGAETTADISAVGATALGGGAYVNASRAMALGRSATSSFASSIAIGGEATTTATHQLLKGSAAYWLSEETTVVGVNGQLLSVKVLTELTTIAAAAFTDTTIQIPANAIAFAASVRVTVAIPTAATFDVGVAGATTRYATAVNVAANTTYPGTDDAMRAYTAATAIRITPNLVPAAATGKVRVTIYYITVTPPTS